MTMIEVTLDPVNEPTPATLWAEAATGSPAALHRIGSDIFAAGAADILRLDDALAASEMLLRLAQLSGGAVERASLIHALGARARYLREDSPADAHRLTAEVYRLLVLAAADGDGDAAEAIASWQSAPIGEETFAIEHFAMRAAAHGDRNALLTLASVFTAAFIQSEDEDGPLLAQAEVLYRLAAAHGDALALGGLADNLVRRGQYEARRGGPAGVAFNEAAGIVVSMATADPLQYGPWLSAYADHVGVDRLRPALSENPSLLSFLNSGGAC